MNTSENDLRDFEEMQKIQIKEILTEEDKEKIKKIKHRIRVRKYRRNNNERINLERRNKSKKEREILNIVKNLKEIYKNTWQTYSRCDIIHL